MMGMFILTALGILVLHNIEKLLAYNVALEAESNSTCQPQLKQSPLTDGNKVEQVIFNNTCSGKQFVIEIRLKKGFAIKYVILYGSDCSSCGGRKLDVFEVTLTDERRTGTFCGLYSKKLSNNGMRVNCGVKHQAYFGARIRSTLNAFEVVALTEIELHTIDEKRLIYIGCFENFQSQMNSTDTTLRDCIVDKCLGYDYAALNSHNICACGNDYPSLSLPLERCNNTCDGDIEFCGGLLEYSVYATTIYLPRYLSCYKIKDLSMLKSLGELSIVDCIIECVRLGYPFALLQDKECSCGYRAVGYPIEGKRCNLQCKNDVDKNSFCGGTDLYTRYSGCEKDHCEKLLHCKENKTDEYGVCVYGCEDGWTGEHCQFIDSQKGFTNWYDLIIGTVSLSGVLVAGIGGYMSLKWVKKLRNLRRSAGTTWTEESAGTTWTEESVGSV